MFDHTVGEDSSEDTIGEAETAGVHATHAAVDVILASAKLHFARVEVDAPIDALQQQRGKAAITAAEFKDRRIESAFTQAFSSAARQAASEGIS